MLVTCGSPAHAERHREREVSADKVDGGVRVMSLCARRLEGGTPRLQVRVRLLNPSTRDLSSSVHGLDSSVGERNARRGE
jgi:hypothetical protein